MGKILEQKITRFDGGMANTRRSENPSKFGVTKNFDVFSYPYKMVPHMRTISTLENTAYDMVKFLYETYNSTSYLYALGIVEGSTKAKIYFVPTANLESGWSAFTKGESTTTGRNEDVFFYYKGYFYMWLASRYLARADKDGGDAFADSWKDPNSGTITNFAQPVHHPSDDIAYFFWDYKVSKLNDTSWTETALTLPSDMYIACATAYGDYLAMGATHTNTLARKSFVFLWNRDDSLTTLSERIDLGEGELLYLVNINNRLIAVINHYTGNTYDQGKGKLLIKIYNGSSFVKVNEIVGGGFSQASKKSSYIKDDKLYFIADLNIDGTTLPYVFVMDQNGNITIDTAIDGAETLSGMYFLANSIWVSHGNGELDYSDTGEAYSTTIVAVYESLIFNGGDASKTKKLISAGVMTEKLPANGQVVLKYRTDGATSWTTIFTHTTDDSMYHEAVNIESSGAILPEYNEIEFRIESTGGAIITGLKYKWEEIPDQLTD